MRRFMANFLKCNSERIFENRPVLGVVMNRVFGGYFLAHPVPYTTRRRSRMCFARVTYVQACITVGRAVYAFVMTADSNS